MERSLILMRHARQSGFAASDHERPLTDDGRDAAVAVGRRLLDQGDVPDQVLSSTALRCRQTWEGVEAGLGRPVPADFEATLYNSAPEALLEGLAGVDPDRRALLLLAHNPGISVLALMLAAGDEAATRKLRGGFLPGTTAQFAIEGDWSTVSPKTARLIRFDPI